MKAGGRPPGHSLLPSGDESYVCWEGGPHCARPGSRPGLDSRFQLLSCGRGRPTALPPIACWLQRCLLTSEAMLSPGHVAVLKPCL